MSYGEARTIAWRLANAGRGLVTGVERVPSPYGDGVTYAVFIKALDEATGRLVVRADDAALAAALEEGRER